jgi:hypothetical protein
MSQQALAQDRVRDLPVVSRQQPGRSARRRPMGIEAGLAVVMLAALSLSLTLTYAAARAMCTKSGYAALALRRDIEDLRAQNALLNYQINLGKSTLQVEQVATQLNLRPADPVRDVDYVAVAPSTQSQVQFAEADPAQSRKGLTSVLTSVASQMASGVEGQAEAQPAPPAQ